MISVQVHAPRSHAMLQLTYRAFYILDIEYWHFLDIGNDICEADASISVRSTKSPPSPPSPPGRLHRAIVAPACHCLQMGYWKI